MRSSAVIPLLLASILSASVSGAAPAAQLLRRTKNEHPKRQVDWADPSHCPGGSIGDADSCTWEATTIYSTPIFRWTQYGSWYDNYNSLDQAGLTETVLAAVQVTDTITETWGVSVGFESQGFSIGGSFDYAKSWATATTASASQTLAVGAQQAGNINVGYNFYIGTGHMKVNYASRKDGHYIWLEEGLEVFSLASNASTYSANVAACGVISQPVVGEYYYNIDDCKSPALFGGGGEY